MKTLKQTFENAGMVDVVTYINSGNIIFSSEEKSKDELSGILEAAIYNDFNLQIKVLIGAGWRLLVSLMYFETWKNDKEMQVTSCSYGGNR